ncbi:PREDICTED: carbon catabolite repressor protein 4 homolog 5 isoform X1 [Populus euphratica]|uniref:Carbon catabolite repressor protein 4 homolog 5 isoform X1 n=1 Tax=Populus euphratica TaxID=75702 RepID=A0AAJ6T760_POPEU|nr:PREDICTED: carbon catabolite repressor protein 4 homolog 5 isoform X1 [Populus euphratica]
MRSLNYRAPAMEHTSATLKYKRKHPFHKKRQYHHRKKQKSVSKIEKTLTLKPHNSNQNPVSLSNRFQSIQRKKSHNYDSNFEYNRKWTFSCHDSPAYEDRVVFVSYNILGVENASKHPDLYFKIPSEFMEWERRKELICKEMHHYNAGILCFQEVDRFDDLDDRLQKDGFRGVYKARTGEACDGCAVFWKDKLFTLLHEEHIEFQSFGLRNNVAQFCVLKMNENQSETGLRTEASKIISPKRRSLVVGNIHVLFNPNRGDIKLGQVRIFLEKAYKLSQEWGNIPIIIGGDLNSLPQSAIYQFLTASELEILLHDRRNISGQLECPPQQKDLRSRDENVARSLIYRWSDEELRLATGNEELTHLQHELKLYSAYLGVPGSRGLRDNRGEPLATSYHSKFMGTVDYIWHTKGLIPVRVLETLPINILRRSAGLPNEKWGSDHLALVCELAFANDGTIV